jgi:hypothetical protein
MADEERNTKLNLPKVFYKIIWRKFALVLLLPKAG